MNTDEKQPVKFLQGLNFFSGLPDADMRSFLKSNVKTYAKHSRLFSQGDSADRFFVIMNGWIKIFRTAPDGGESVIALYTSGDVFGEAAIFGGAGYPFSAEAAEESRVLEIPAPMLRERARTNPKIMDRVMRSMSRELHQTQMENEHLALMSAPQRVGCLLLQLSSGMIGKGGTFSFPYDKSLAAARLGMKPETFSRALSQIKPLGVEVRGPEIHIKDFSRLIDYCCYHCSSPPGECQGKEGRCGDVSCSKRKKAR